jgi:hypothetical protein
VRRHHLAERQLLRLPQLRQQHGLLVNGDRNTESRLRGGTATTIG